MAKKVGAKKAEGSLVGTMASKEFREISTNVNKRMNEWSDALAKVRGQSPDEVKNEIQAFYLHNLRKTDDLATLAKENIANLTMKEELKIQTKMKHLERKYQKAIDNQDEDTADYINEQIINLLTNTDNDHRMFKAVNEAIKTIKNLEPKVINHNHNIQDDKEIFDIKEGVYTE